MGTLQVGGTTLGVKNTSTNKVDLSNVGDVTLTSSANIKGAINASGDAPIYACRAWVNFDMSDTSNTNPLSFENTNATNHGDANSAGETLCAIRGSGNVSKVVRNGTGDHTITFTTPMVNANYCATGSAGNTTTDPSNENLSCVPVDEYSVRVESYSTGSTAIDQNYVMVAIFN